MSDMDFIRKMQEKYGVAGAEPVEEVATPAPEQSPILDKSGRLGSIDPVMAENLTNMAKEYYKVHGTPLVISDSMRTTAEQAELKKRKPSKAATPGRSKHEAGLAVDIDPAQANWLDEAGHLSNFGFTRIRADEPYHLEFSPQSLKVAATGTPADSDMSFIRQMAEKYGGLTLPEAGAEEAPVAAPPVEKPAVAAQQGLTPEQHAAARTALEGPIRPTEPETLVDPIMYLSGLGGIARSMGMKAAARAIPGMVAGEATGRMAGEKLRESGHPWLALPAQLGIDIATGMATDKGIRRIGSMAKAARVKELEMGTVADLVKGLRGTPEEAAAGISKFTKSGGILPGASVFPEGGLSADTLNVLKTYGVAKQGAKVPSPLADLSAQVNTRQETPLIQVKTGLKVGLRKTPEFGAFQTPLRISERIDEYIPGFKEKVYYPQRYLQKEAEVQFKEIEKASRLLEKELPSASGERIMLHALAQQEFPGFKEGATISGAEYVRDILGKEVPELTPQEMSAYRWMREHLDSLYKQISQARVAAGEEPFEPVKDYFTVMRRMSDPRFADDVMKLKKDFFTKEVPFYPYEISREGSRVPVALDAFKVFRRYAEKTIRWSHQAPHMAAVRKLASEVQDKQPYMSAFLKTWMDGIMGERHPATGIKNVDQAIRTLNRNLPTSVLGYSIRTGLVQFSSLPNAYAATGEWIFPGLVKAMSPRAWKQAHEMSYVLTQREPEVGLGKISDALLTQGRKGQFQKAGFWFLRAIDDYVATGTWWAGMMKGARKGLSGKDLVNYADDLMLRTQGSAAGMDRPLAQHSDLGRFALLFETFNLNQLGQLLQDIGGIGYKTPKKLERLKMGIRLLGGTAAMGALYDMAGFPSPMPIHEAGKKLYAGITEGKPLSETAIDTGEQLLGLLPGLGGIRYGYGSVLGAGPSMVSKGAQQFGKGVAGIGRGTQDAGEIIRNLLVPIMQFKGIPGTVPLSRLSEWPGKRTMWEALAGKSEPEPPSSRKRRPSREEIGRKQNIIHGLMGLLED